MRPRTTAASLARALPSLISPRAAAVSTGPQRFLAVDEKSGANAFAMRPDAVGMKHGQVAWIICTKWKQLSPQEAWEGASQADLYQMYAYAHNYGCGDVVLLYPITRHSARRAAQGLAIACRRRLEHKAASAPPASGRRPSI